MKEVPSIPVHILELWNWEDKSLKKKNNIIMYTYMYAQIITQSL